MKRPKTQLQEILYLLLYFTVEKRKCISQSELREITYQNCITARISELRALGVVIEHKSVSFKNKFGRKGTMAKYFIPWANIEKAKEIYKELTKDI